MKVWMVTFAVEIVEGVFSSREKAQAYIDSGEGTGGNYPECKKDYDVYELEVDNPRYMEEAA